MASFNQWIGMGNLTRDPQSKFLPSGVNVCEFGVACNRKYKDAGGNEKEDVLFIDCAAFGKRGDVIQEHFTKGKPIMVVARLKLDTWDDKDGGKRSKISAIVDEFQFVGGRDGGGEGQNIDRSTDQTQAAGQRRQWKPTQNKLVAARGPGSRPAPAEQPYGDDQQFAESDIPFKWSGAIRQAV